jgi:nucleotide-binding universal stress UspA family protein
MSSKITNILVATDFSDPSLNALTTASALAVRHQASLFIIHVHETLPGYTDPAEAPDTNITIKNSNVLTALEADVYRKTNIIPFIIKEKGHVTETIINKAIQHKCGLIVMGSYGASGYRDGFIGTNSYNVIKFAACPVLLIPPGRKWTFFRDPLFPIRPVFTELRNYDIIRNFISQDSTLQVLGLSPFIQGSSLNELNKLVEEIKKNLHVDKVTASIQHHADLPAPDNVLRHAGQGNTDLIIITPAIDLSAKQFYVGPNAHKIIHHCRIPLLNINKKTNENVRMSENQKSKDENLSR